MFKEFSEFSNPESADYDIKTSLQEPNIHLIEILDMVGFLEDGEWEQYGITQTEYENPTQETVDKIRAHLEKISIEPLIKK